MLITFAARLTGIDFIADSASVCLLSHMVHLVRANTHAHKKVDLIKFWAD